MIELRNPTGRNTNAHIVTINSNDYFFSYETCIAFRGSSAKQVLAVSGPAQKVETTSVYHRVRLANHWGPTTGRHFRELGCGDFPIVSYELFEEIVEGATN